MKPRKKRTKHIDKLKTKCAKHVPESGTVLAIDPASLSVGYAVLDIETEVVLEAGVIEAPPRSETGMRFRLIMDVIEELMDEYQPDVCGIELITKRRTTHVTLIRSTGAVMAAMAGPPLIEVDPTVWHFFAPDGYVKSDDGDAEQIALTIIKLRDYKDG